MKPKRILILLFAALLAVSASAKAKHTFAINDGNFVYDGKAIQVHSGEMHYSRVPAPYWRHRLKMIKAMGLNAVTTYVFWNHHETAPGKWDWTTGNRNIGEFLQTAAEEGLMVILRPGPYACGEWEYGGYPWWLHTVKGMEVRTDNQPFLDSCRTYINQLAAQVKKFQITKGGPMVMVQAENEFGSYVSQRKDIPLEVHKAYSAKIKQMLIDAGFDVPMFTSDGSWLFKGGTIEGALPTANGEDDIKQLRKVVDEYNGGKGPYMVAEFYPGWLDHWNEPFVKVSADRVVAQTKKYLDEGIHFNYYMVHGGTNFGFTSGANYSNSRNIQPDITSYDYDAPISEAGWATPKYDALCNLMKQYVKYDVPAVPERIPVIEIPHIKLSATVGLFDLLGDAKPVECDTLMTFEDMRQGHGYMLYRRHFNQPISGMMHVPGIADFATVYVNGDKVGVLNRLTGKDSLEVNIPFNATLDILVENMGRINYGSRITENWKGITKPITIGEREITGNWQMFGLPMDAMPTQTASSACVKGQPTLYFGSFNLDKVGDTFLDMEKWGKGIVFVNGVNLGRYWKVGPQQTLYLPGCFLNKGVNNIVVFEQLNDEPKSELSGVANPVLDKLVKE